MFTLKNTRKFIFGLLFCLLVAGAATAQTTTFTYQGKLTDAAVSANGTYDFEFALFDALTAGAQIGSTQTVAGVTVTNGIFTVQLDFGAAAFPGANRFLEIRVKKPADASYTPLAPRQQVTSAPYSIRALTAGTADLATNATNAANAVNADTLDGTDSSGFVLTNTTAFIRNQTTAQTADFNISGTGTANILNAGVQYNIRGNRILSNGGTNNLFAGVGAGAANTMGFNNSFVGYQAGFSNTTGRFNSFFGAFAGFSNTTGTENSFVGFSAGESNTTGNNNTIIGNNADVSQGDLTFATALGAGAVVSTSNTIALGRSNGFDRVRIFGLGAAGATTLCRNASNEISTCSSSLRYKTNIAPFNFGLNLINQLRPISFDWKAGGMADIGFGAEDVAAINPLFVNYNAKGEVEGVKYDRLSVVFVNAIKEQQTQIEEQRQQLKQQQLLIDGLRKLVCQTNTQADVCKEK